MKINILTIASAAIALLLASCHGSPHYWKGADIGWATEYESRGLKFFNRDGEERECTALMKELGLDADYPRPVFVNSLIING